MQVYLGITTSSDHRGRQDRSKEARKLGVVKQRFELLRLGLAAAVVVPVAWKVRLCCADVPVDAFCASVRACLTALHV